MSKTLDRIKIVDHKRSFLIPSDHHVIELQFKFKDNEEIDFSVAFGRKEDNIDTVASRLIALGESMRQKSGR